MSIVFFLFLSLFNAQHLTAQIETNNAVEAPIVYSFNYKDAPLVDIINEWAAQKNINIILPQPQSPQAITAKLTYGIPGKITLEQAWEELNKILELLGYSWVPYNNLHNLIKISTDIKREALPVFVSPHLAELPDNGTVIQAIFYLSNLKLKDEPTRAAVDSMLKSMLSATADVKRDEKTNALILTDKSNNIRSVMTIIQELDLEGIPDALEVVPLYYTEAPFVEEIFRTKLLPTIPTQPTPTAQGVKQAAYFPQNTKIVALPRTNNIVIMGSIKAIRIVKDFLVKYIDKPLESGGSILHIYDLQYLNAEDFAEILQGLVSKTNTGQAQTQATGGFRRDFQDVIIVAEKSTLTSARPKTAKAGEITPTEAPTQGGEAPAAQSQGIEQAGNRLLIAARNEDWLKIKKIIQELDRPLPQVAIEVLVVDLSLTDNKLLGNQMRNKEGFNDSALTKNINFQTAMIDSPVLRPEIDLGIVDPSSFESVTDFPANALMANLLQASTEDANLNLAREGGIGSVVISFNDNSGTWNILQMLKARTNSELIASPYIVTTDNKQASIAISQQRLIDGEAVSQVGAIKVQRENVPATISIDILPRISLESNSVNLNIIINVNQFLPENNNRTTRLIQTNANVGNKESLSLGGLIRLSDSTEDREVPLLSKVPILGWLFKRRQKNKEKNNLMVFITPTIIYPRNYKRKSFGGYEAHQDFTQSKLCIAQNDMAESTVMDNLRDPITRWFFKPDPDFAQRVIDNYEQQNNLLELDPNYSACRPPTIRPTYGPGAEYAANTQTCPPVEQKIAHNSNSSNNQSETLKQMVMHEDNPLEQHHKPVAS